MLGGRNRFVLVVGDGGGVLVHLAKGRVRDALFCPVPGEDGRDPEPLRPYLLRHRRLPVHVLLDVHEQMYREEVLPRANPLDRGKVLRRRLDLAFPDTRLKAALPVRGGKSGAMLFCGVPEVEPLVTWLAFLDSVPNPVSGLSLLPLESRAMLAPLTGEANGNGAARRGLAALLRRSGPAGVTHWRVLITEEASGGLRHIVERDGNLLVTRLTPAAPDAQPAEIAEDIEREFRSTITYIKRMGYLEGAPLDLVVVAAPATGQALAALDLPARLHAMTPQEAARRLGLPKVGPPETPYADVLHAVWFARRRPVLTLHTPATRRLWLLAEAERVAPLAAVSATLAVGYFVGDVAMRYVDALETSQIRSRQLVSARAELAELERQFDGLAVPFEEMRVVIGLREQLDRQSLALRPLLRALAESLNGEAIVTGLRLTVEERRGRRPPPRRTDGPPPHSIQLEVRFLDTGGMPEAIVQAATELKERLARSLPDYSVAFAQMPVNVLPDQTLEGQLDEQTGLAGEVEAVGAYTLEWRGQEPAS